MIPIQHLMHWLTQNPLGTATLLYMASVAGVLVYAYFEPRDQHQPTERTVSALQKNCAGGLWESVS